ncbi:MAG TPA: YtxH domain-containing protein [Bryobacteraceae bacterium]|jgi:gas vesicle protein|nr:YtxH domain-containing protein [Bryobacteraceae bacterium]
MFDHDKAQDNLANNIGWFVAGTVVGLTVAVLLTPQSGKDARQFIAGKTQQGKDAVTGTGKEVYDRSKDMIDKGRQLVEDAADLFDRGRKLVRGL